MKTVAVLAFVLAAAGVASGRFVQPGETLQGQLRQLFPAAASFSGKRGRAAALQGVRQRQTITGYAFWTTELEPLERGYDGPIKILVGSTPRGF